MPKCNKVHYESEESKPQEVKKAPLYDTEKFPWVSKKQLLAHYNRSLESFLEATMPGDSKTHISDLSAWVATFNDAWWSIFEEIDYHRVNE